MAVIEQEEGVIINGHTRYVAAKYLQEQTQIERVIAETIVAEPEAPSIIDGLVPSVQVGVAWLDENIPGWADRIDLETFDIVNSDQCILGQLEGNYADGIAKWFGREPGMGLKNDEGVKHGFLWENWREHSHRSDESDALQDSWIRVITARQASFDCAHPA